MKTYLLLIPAIFLAGFLYLPVVFDYFVATDGEWGEWSDWSRCMKYCGPSWQGRYRNCTKPHKGYGKPCEVFGPRVETRKCFLRECPIDGHPGEWGSWGGCDKDCVEGVIKRYRPCDNPKPQNHGLGCVEPLQERRPCPNQKPCPVDGKYEEWSKWSECSVTCGKGKLTRERKCIGPEQGGKPCEKGERDTENQDCEKGACPTKPRTTKKPEAPNTEKAKTEPLKQKAPEKEEPRKSR